MSARLRVGSVPYLVGRPVDQGLQEEPGIDFKYAQPAELVDDLRAGRVDVALVSSIELFRRPGYSFLEGPVVAGRGFVGSVQLFLRRPLEEVRRIALDPASRTARTLLADRASGPPEFLEVPRGEHPRDAEADGWLLIGDEALRETLASPAPSFFNPSAEWCQRTGLPFVFATWIVRPGVDMHPHAAAFARARSRGTQSVEQLAREAAQRWQLPEQATRRYLLEECCFDLGAEMEPALLAFRDAAAALELCRADLCPDGICLSGAAVP